MAEMHRIAVFYDGQYFANVSNFYKFSHARKSRINFHGLHNFIEEEVSREEGVDRRLCQIVESHFFRGRFSLPDLRKWQIQKSDDAYVGRSLEADRTVDDLLSTANITTHYLKMATYGERTQEKGVDVWLALEAYDLAVHKKFDVLVLIACDSDFVPLVRKLNSIGTRVMLLAWDLESVDATGQKNTTRTSQNLIEECSYPVLMNQRIDARDARNDITIDRLFRDQA